jgi:hypothetical protein
MNKSNVIELEGRAVSADPLTDLLRTGARQLLHYAIEAKGPELHTARRLYLTDSARHF